MYANQPQEDEAGRHFVKVDFNINDVRLLANAVNFYLEKRVEFFDEDKKFWGIGNCETCSRSSGRALIDKAKVILLDGNFCCKTFLFLVFVQRRINVA